MLLRISNISHFFSIFFVLQVFFVSCSTEQKDNDPTKSPSVNIPDDSLLKMVQSLNRKGTSARDNAQYKDALNKHFEAYHLAKENNDTIGQIYALNNIGTDLRRTSSNSEASSYHYAALELAGNNPELLKSRAVAMNGLGNIFLSLNKPEQAKTYFDQSLLIEKQLESNLGQAINYANIAETFRMKNQFDSALFYYNQSLKQNQIIKSDIGIAICKKSIGKVYLAQGKTEEGLKLMKEAVSLMEDSKDAFHVVEMEIALCNAFIENNRLDEAEPHLTQVILLSYQMSSYDQLYTAYNLLSQLKEKQQKYLEALQSNKQMMAYRDSVLSQNNEIRILELENRYRNKQASQQIRLLETENVLNQKNKREQIRILLFVITVLSVLASVFYYRYRNRRHLASELEKINEIKSRFFTNISHEFRTPLTLIKAPVENILEEKIANERIDNELNIVLRNANQMLFLVEQLLNISKIDSGKFSIHVQPGDLAMNIHTISNSFEYVASRKSIVYNRRIAPSGYVWYDANIIEILVINLLSNAIKFTPEHGRVVLETFKTSDTYEISLENETEKEMTDEQLKSLFDRFYTTANDSKSGTGIGLSLVKDICALYRAKVNLDYDNKLLKFTIHLPVNKSHFSDEEILSEVTPDTVQPGDRRKSEEKIVRDDETPIILIVEDVEDMRDFLQEIFQNDFQIILAKDGDEGIDKAREIVPDIIVSDVMMPNVNGLTLCNTLKNDYLTNHIPIILLTALNEQDNVVKGLESKADDYIAKPFNPKILQAKVVNLLENRDLLIRKYKEEFGVHPMDAEWASSEKSFSSLLNNLTPELMNPDFGVGAFCNVCAMSRTQLHRKLKATTGLSATAYIRFRRIRIAAEMLKNPEMSVTDVCYKSGFSDTSYFSKCFKKEMKLSPAEYRKKTLK